MRLRFESEVRRRLVSCRPTIARTGHLSHQGRRPKHYALQPRGRTKNESAAPRHHAEWSDVAQCHATRSDVVLPLRVDSDNFAATSSHQQNTLQAFCQHVQKVHVCTTLDKECTNRAAHYNIIHYSLVFICLVYGSLWSEL